MTTQQSSDESVPLLFFRNLRWPPSNRATRHPDAAGRQIDALSEALAREEILLHERDALVLEQEALRTESDHRLFNGLQMVVSLLSLQSRAASTPGMAAQLSIAASRVATIERIHRRLRYNDGEQSVAFKKYLEEFCRDFTGIMEFENSSEQTILVEGTEIVLPATTAISLGFIVNELVTNAVKYGTGDIRVTLDREPEGGHMLSVSNAGPALPKNYDPASSKGLGMRIVQSFANKIGGKLIFARNDADQGARISVLFS